MVGIATIFSAANQSLPRVSGQLVNMAVALAVMYVAANLPPHFRIWSRWICRNLQS